MSGEKPGSFQCPICYDNIKKPTLVRACGHCFCEGCINNWMDSQKKDFTCPFCRQKMGARKKATVRIQPKIDHSFVPTSAGDNKDLEKLKAELSKTQKLHDDEEASFNEHQQKQKLEIESIERQLDTVKRSLKPLEDNTKKYTDSLNARLKEMPEMRGLFEKLFLEISRDNRQLKSVEPYNDIHETWKVACQHARTKRMVQDQLEHVRKQTAEMLEKNAERRKTIAEFGPEEFSRRISPETFEKLCAVMNWEQRAPLASVQNKHSVEASQLTDSVSRPKKPKMTQQWFNDGLYDF